ncbi:MAG: hypothetical protein VKO39_09255 [Cyanobacteriota bacterium]|nr:hypothetical protein [Cyanobacteriota bacterium]
MQCNSLVPGFEQLFCTNDFSRWEAAVKGSLGSHQSHLRSRAESFHTCCHGANVGALRILHLQGKGELELERTQVGSGVLWLPLRGSRKNASMEGWFRPQGAKPFSFGLSINSMV